MTDPVEAQRQDCLNIMLGQKWHSYVFQISAEKSFQAWYVPMSLYVPELLQKNISMKKTEKTDSVLTWKKTFPHLSPIIVAEQVKEINLLARYGATQCSQILSEVTFEYIFETQFCNNQRQINLKK